MMLRMMMLRMMRCRVMLLRKMRWRMVMYIKDDDDDVEGMKRTDA